MRAADGILIGLGLLAGVAFGPIALLVAVPGAWLLDLVGGQVRWRLVSIALLTVLLGAARGSSAPAPSSVDDIAASQAATGVVTSLPAASGAGERVIISLERIQLADEMWIPAAGQVLLYLPEMSPPVNTGDRLSFTWLATPAAQLPPGYRSYLLSQGASASARARVIRVEEPGSTRVRAFTDARRGITRMLRRAIPGDAGALAAGIVTGDDSALTDEARQAFRRTGTSHVTAVSGQNVALLVGCLALGLPPKGRRRRWIAHGVMFVAIWLYVGMVGLDPPALRAGIVATAMMLGTWFGRRPDPLTILALTLGVMALIDPAMVGSVGFLLSAAASWALCSSLTTRERPTLISGAVDSVKGVMAANIATLPILLWVFGEWSPVSLLANVLLGPVMGIAFPASYGLVLIGALAPFAMPWVAWAPAIPLDVSLVIVHRLADVLPLIQLPVTGPGMALLVTAPCFAILLLLSRDGARWLRFLRWHRGRGRGVEAALIAGFAAGVLVTLARTLSFWP